MKCDRCENEATVHEVTRKQGVTVEKHLCEKCAAQQGLAPQMPSAPIAEMIALAMSNPAAIAMPAPPGAVIGAVCPTCGTSFAEFKASGVLGCPDCYAAFEGQLAPLIERAHEGAIRHMGKIPKRLLSGAMGASGATASSARDKVLGDDADRRTRRAALRKQLEHAIETEQYERAAALRDEIARLSEMGVLPPEEGKSKN
jgi:protein arginine kinase activator